MVFSMSLFSMLKLKFSIELVLKILKLVYI